MIEDCMSFRERYIIAGIFVGFMVMLTPFLDLMNTLSELSAAFETPARGGIEDPAALSEHVRVMVVSAALKFGLLPIGAIIFAFSLRSYRRLKRSTPPPLPPQSSPPPLPPQIT